MHCGVWLDALVDHAPGLDAVPVGLGLVVKHQRALHVLGSIPACDVFSLLPLVTSAELGCVAGQEGGAEEVWLVAVNAPAQETAGDGIWGRVGERCFVRLVVVCADIPRRQSCILSFLMLRCFQDAFVLRYAPQNPVLASPKHASQDS